MGNLSFSTSSEALKALENERLEALRGLFRAVWSHLRLHRRLREIFEELKSEVMTERDTGRSRGFGFVTFEALLDITLSPL